LFNYFALANNVPIERSQFVPYHIHPNPQCQVLGCVKAWAPFHLPYAENASYRPEVHGPYHRGLRITYKYPVGYRVRAPDLDGVLLYNVNVRPKHPYKDDLPGDVIGTGIRSLRLERLNELAPLPDCYPAGIPFAYVHYEVEPLPSMVQFYANGTAFAEFGPTSFQPRILNDRRRLTGRLWRLLKTDARSIQSENHNPGQPFKARIILSVPHILRLPLAVLAKPLIDAVVSAFHFRNAIAQHVLNNLCQKNKWDDHPEVYRLICDRAQAVLGRCDQAPSDKCRWNPIDGPFDACEIVREDSENDEYSIKGYLFH
jgi:hypothetical protein